MVDLFVRQHCGPKRCNAFTRITWFPSLPRYKVTLGLFGLTRYMTHNE